jgi:hypothetical protein
LLADFEKHLVSLKRSRFTIRQYKSIWKIFRDYTATHGILFYDRSVGDQFIETQLGSYRYPDLSQIEKRLVNTIDALYVFKEAGSLHMGPAPLKRKPPRKFEGEIGLVIKAFIDYGKRYSL